MPTIEIASINAKELRLNQDDFEFAIIEENKLRSHRGLFHNILTKQKGVIVHIGNPEFINEKNGFYYGSDLIDWDFQPTEIIIPEYDKNEIVENNGANQVFNFKFLNQYKNDIDKLLKIALVNSPIKKICFLTDYQFGSENARVEIIYTISDFWELHNSEGLCFNTLYEMYGI